MSSTTGAARIENDRYYTEDRLARAIVSWLAEDFVFGLGPYSILEPSIGGGAFARACEEQWPLAEIDGCDIDANAAGLALCVDKYVTDFVTMQPHRTPCLVVGNPPFAWAEEHARKACDIATGGIVALLLRTAFFHGRKRTPFWAKYPARHEYRLIERPSFTGGGTDSCEYSVFVWTPGREVHGPGHPCERKSWKGKLAEATE